MDPTGLDVVALALALAVVSLLMVLAGLDKSQLVWKRRPPFWRRRRR